ncbi:phage portal protein [Limosilactobacillus ingluviei]|uniref:phage portal protein n=1 Tax=Limosilactobacillus ingluviei TaxID=148604 RepID=UPI00265F54A2|nr:phage portal protein [Limosilactobacillus ingluviei]
MTELFEQQRFNAEANRVYRMPVGFFDAMRNNPTQLFTTAYKFARHHVDNQVPRLKGLMDYYVAKNQIKQWPGSPNPKNAHNRIASAFARYITNIRVGYFLGNDIQFKVAAREDQDKATAATLADLIDNYNRTADEVYIDEMIKKDLSIMGRAYDLVYANAGTNTLNLAKVDPTTAFVVYDDSIKGQPLFALRYYQTGVLDEHLVEQYEIYTDDRIYRFHSEGGLPDSNTPTNAAVFDGEEYHFFGRVPLTEYRNNEERMGDWEPELDHLDALDKTVSTMANFQEDFNSAALVATGQFANKTEPVYARDEHGNKKIGKDGKPVVLVPAHPVINAKDNIFWLKPAIVEKGLGAEKEIVMPSLKYLTKQYDSTGWSTYTNFLINEIHKYTNTPNVNDKDFASNASGVAMSYKLWGSDQERKIQEALFKKSLMDRLACCINYWTIGSKLKGEVDDLLAMVTPNLDPNLPKNDDQTAQLIQTLKSTGLFSGQTLREKAEPITEVNAEAEQQRIDDEAKHEADVRSQEDAGDFGIGRVFANGQLPNQEQEDDEA